MPKPLISVLTPAYNRADRLPALKASLDAQNRADFEWIVVDDGSSDGTAALLESWKGRTAYELVTLSLPNGGKHRALNRGMELVSGDWTFVVDSDDRLPPHALASIASAVSRCEGNANCGGIVGLKAHGDGSPITGDFPEGVALADSIELRYRYGIKADKAEVFRTEVLRAFPFPEFEGERFMSEAVVWNRIARAGWTLFLLDKVIYEADYLPGGLSAASLALRVGNPLGTRLFYREKLELDLPAKAAFREAVNFGRFAFHEKAFGAALRELDPGRRPLAILAAPLGWAAKIMDTRKLEKAAREKP